MTSQPLYGVAELYSEYISKRQSGEAMDKVINELQSFTNQLSKGERKQLAQIIQAWESREGINYKPRPKHAAVPDSRPAAGMAQNPIRPIELLPSYQAVHPENPTGLTSDAEQRAICPHCGESNNATNTYCYACRYILIRTRTGTKALDNKDPEMRWDTAYFGQLSAVLLMVRGAHKPLAVTLNAEMIIGRSANGSATRPDIDLAPYNAESLGVSRLHAALKRLDNTVAISDLNSVNHTYINGQRLHSHEVRVLRDGDEIRLGKLVITVAFKYNLRRLSNGVLGRSPGPRH